MLNTSYDEKFGKKGLTFDDVLSLMRKVVQQHREMNSAAH